MGRQPRRIHPLLRAISGVFTFVLLLLLLFGGLALLFNSSVDAPGRTQAKVLVIPKGEGAHEIAARLWQHEIDHLDGILYIDKMWPLGKLSARSTLRDLEAKYKKAQEKGDIPPDEEIEKFLKELEDKS